MKKILLFFIFISCFELLRAQTTVDGKIITEDGRTITAKIKLATDESTPQSFQYSSTGNESFTEIKTENIRSVEFSTGELYEKYSITVPVMAGDFTERQKADYFTQKNILSENVLVERLITGPTSLYQFFR